MTFEVGGRAMTESAFFARIARERVAVVPALRALLTTYLAVQPGVVEARKLYRQIWGPEDDQGALAPAMQALLHLDPTAHDVYRDYLAQRDGEHEVYSTDVMMRTYIAEAGWRDRAMIRFGVYFALIQYRDGLITLSGGFLEEYGVLDAAEGLLEPVDFATLILEELDGFAARPDLDCRLGKDDLYREPRDHRLRADGPDGARGPIRRAVQPHVNDQGRTICAANTGDASVISHPKTSSVPIVPNEVEGTLEAPVIYFEATSTHGFGGGVGRLALEMMLSEPGADGGPVSRRKIVVHLRGPMGALVSLKGAIEHIEEMAAGPLTAAITDDQKHN
ncbi:hypothetical protein [Methylobacterium radiotolerans]|uniref:hypothetical protein n=1 Tax=Methylobacterium radiotolerans TaxID=31998 RepID=UPI001FCC6F8A|nr:hypothetical protein [Methylobacterium radiotolerans]